MLNKNGVQGDKERIAEGDKTKETQVEKRDGTFLGRLAFSSRMLFFKVLDKVVCVVEGFTTFRASAVFVVRRF